MLDQRGPSISGMTNQPEQWLTPEDVATMLQIAPGTLANWRTQRRGPAFKRLGGIVRYNPDALAAWIEAQPSE